MSPGPAQGYRQLAETLWESLLRDMTRVEFNLAKGRAPATDVDPPSARSRKSHVANPYRKSEAADPAADTVEQAPVDATAVKAEHGAPELRSRG